MLRQSHDKNNDNVGGNRIKRVIGPIPVSAPPRERPYQRISSSLINNFEFVQNPCDSKTSMHCNDSSNIHSNLFRF